MQNEKRVGKNNSKKSITKKDLQKQRLVFELGEKVIADQKQHSKVLQQNILTKNCLIECMLGIMKRHLQYLSTKVETEPACLN